MQRASQKKHPEHCSPMFALASLDGLMKISCQSPDDGSEGPPCIRGGEVALKLRINRTEMYTVCVQSFCPK